MKTPLLAAVLVLTLGAGCAPQFPTPLISSSANNNDEAAKSLTLERKTITLEETLSPAATCAVYLEYPSLSNGTGSAAETAVSVSIGKVVARALQTELVLFTEQDIQAAAQTYMSDCMQEVQTELSRYHDGDLIMDLNRYVALDYTETINTPTVLSILFTEESYTGGAHPEGAFIPLNVDVRTGQELAIQEVIAPDKLQDFYKVERGLLINGYPDSLYTEVFLDFEAAVDNPNQMSLEEQVFTYGDQTNFTISPQGLTTYYNAYQIAPYAASPITVDLPLGTIEPLINTAGPLPSLLTPDTL